ncbi:putative muskelin [Ordospora pajunii]|uniref:putative muskelin n=1 Tax=Ordospora pajunii TaxID=3039483 RepID=UPI0029527C27|nr:putative muskelin [Ordospora pajunii]KAH9412045.1 putative muskelin [Ordospora pajunii]
MLDNRNAYTPIPYEIHDYSTYASIYAPENIKKNDPTDPNSRWSTTSNDHHQYIVLRVPPCIAATCTFGKYTKMHVCNIKKMKISISEDGLRYREVFYGGLRNDTEMETFNLKILDDIYMIARYIKIEPLAAWGINFNYSLWFVELRGITDIDTLANYNQQVVFQRTLRRCLAFLRDNGFRDIYKELESRCGHKSKGSAAKKIRSLLEQNMHDEAEAFIESLDPSVFQEFIDNSAYALVWAEIPKKDVWPCERGGHQMVEMDGSIYLHGGWNGTHELEDFWKYTNGTWEQLSSGVICPGRRSCHRMVAHNSKLYLTGKYIPLSSRKECPTKNNLWVYNGEWRPVAAYDEQGPGNIYDHQMVVAGHMLCVFGGKSTEREDTYSGLYVLCLDTQPVISTGANTTDAHMEMPSLYECNASSCAEPVANAGHSNCTSMHSRDSMSSNEYNALNMHSGWRMVRSDAQQPENTPALRSRMGHAMLYIPQEYVEGSIYNNSIVIVGGQRGKESIKEMEFYKLDTDTVFDRVMFPIKGDGKVVQRSLLYQGQIVVLFCYGRDKEDKLEEMEVYTYSLLRRVWTKVVEKPGIEGGVKIKPSVRSAHQFVECNGSFYVFGGNVPEKGDTRMNDIWVFNLMKASTHEICHLCKLLIRKHRYLYLLGCDEEAAIEYLQSSIASMVIDNSTREIFEELCQEVYERTMDTNTIEDVCKLLPDEWKQ